MSPSARLAACLIALAVPATAAAASAPPGRDAIEKRVHDIRAWLTAPIPGISPPLPNGAVRTATLEARDDAITEQLNPGQPQATAICKSLEFLAHHARHYAADPTAKQDLAQFVSLLEELRSTQRDALHYGAIANDRTRRMYITFSNAICGSALLAAHQVLRNPRLLEMANGIGSYLLRLHETGDALARSEPFGLFDRVTHDARIQVTSTTWNAVAAKFLHDLARAGSNERFAAHARRVAAFQVQGIEGGYDYFAPQLDRSDKRLIFRWNLGYSRKPGAPGHDFADGKWHRQGDIRQPPTGTIGTDQIEYGLQALHAMGWDREHLRRIYLKYRNMPNTVSCLDAGISFSGYFRITDDTPASAYGSYYDIVGAGILASLKRDLAPEDYEKSITAMMKNDPDWTMLDCKLQPVWSQRGNSTVSRRSTLVAATTGIALLGKMSEMKTGNAFDSRMRQP